MADTCTVAHRTEAAAAKCGKHTQPSDQPTVAPEQPTVLVTADDLRGVLSLLGGRLVRRGTGVLAVSTTHPTAPDLPGQVADQPQVVGLLLESGATLRPSWIFTPSEFDAAAALLTAQLAAEDSATTRALKPAA